MKKIIFVCMLVLVLLVIGCGINKKVEEEKENISIDQIDSLELMQKIMNLTDKIVVLKNERDVLINESKILKDDLKQKEVQIQSLNTELNTTQKKMIDYKLDKEMYKEKYEKTLEDKEQFKKYFEECMGGQSNGEEGRIQNNTSEECIDSDSGINSQIFGIVTDKEGSYEDKCVSGLLVEYYCEGNYKAYQVIRCPNVCENGRCNV